MKLTSKLNISTKVRLFLIIILLGSGKVMAQFDVLFHMPPVWNTQQGSTNDPAELVLTTIAPTANVNIRTPDGTTFNQNYVVNTGASVVVPLTTVLGMTANINTAELDKGLIITSDVQIQAVYRLDASNNKAIATLKGQIGLGQDFYAGSQTYTQAAQYGTNDKHFISIMATEDNTNITLETEQGFTFQGQGGNPTSFTLNQFETYLVRSDNNATESPSGCHITSDKDISVISGGQHIRIIGGSAGDAGIDQIVPVSELGSEFIVVRGGVGANFDYAMIVAASDGTQITVDGVVLATINEGETYEYHLPGTAANFGDAHYIITSNPAYVYHCTGSGQKNDEVGMAIIPTIDCTGSRYIRFTRFPGSRNSVTITIPTAALATLTYNGALYSTYATATTQVVASNPLYTAVTINDADIANDNVFIADDYFHLGLLVGNGSAGTYGFLSGFSSSIDILNPFSNLPADIYIVDSLYQGTNSNHCLIMQSCGDSHKALTIVNSPNTGATTILPAPADTCFTYTASLTYGGFDTIQVFVTNNLGFSDSVYLVYNVYAPPVASTDSFNYDQCNPPVSGYTVTDNDTDVNGDMDTSTVTILVPPLGAGNTAVVQGSGAILFTPSSTFGGRDSLIYQVCDNSGLCDTSYLKIIVSQPPTVDAGIDFNVCENNPTATLNGAVTVASGGYWTGGNGTYVVDTTTLNATYTPTAAEIAAGSVTLTLTNNSDAITGSFDITTSDDGEEGASSTNLTSNDLQPPGEGIVGVRFQNIGIPAGAIITNSYVQFTARNGSSGAHNATLQIEDTDDSAPLTTGDDDITGRNFVATTINWSPPDWNDNESGVNQRTPDLSTLLQTVVNRPGWSSGNDMLIKWDATGSDRRASSINDNAAEAPVLHVEYQIGGCPQVTDQVTITIDPQPTVNAGADDDVCENNPTLTLNGSVTNATGGGWTNGGGVYAPDTATLNASYTLSPAEVTAGSARLILITTGNGGCNAVSDTVDITVTPTPVVDAGPDDIVCLNDDTVTLAGSVTIASGGQWTNGGGLFIPSNTDLNAAYVPSGPERTAGLATLILNSTGNGKCLAVTDTMEISIEPSPTASSGSLYNSCSNNPNIALTGAVTIATGGEWTSLTGGGFSPSNTDLNATYIPTAGEISSGIAIFYLKTTGNGTCLPAYDTAVAVIQPAPTVSAGPDHDICSNNPVVPIDATVGGVTQQWVGGSGTFLPNRTTVDVTYTATQAEIDAGQIVLTLETTQAGCLDVTDSLIINFTAPPTADAGPDQTLCANNADVQLNGAVTIATGGYWANGLGSYNPDSTTLNAIYTPDPLEITSGSVDLILVTTGNGNCLPESDTMTVDFTGAPTVDAGPADTSCANNSILNLNGSVTIATGGSWSGGTGSYINSNTDLVAQYSPSQPEIDAGSVTLTLTSTGIGNCSVVTDQVTHVIIPAPIVDAGVNQTVCSDNPTVNLNGSVTGATGGQWTSGGGVFSPDRFTLNASYVPTIPESSAGTVRLYLNSTGNGLCNFVRDSIDITITPTPTVDAGPDQVVCGDVTGVAVNGVITNSGGGSWSTLGVGGGFTPNNTTLNTSFNPSGTDKTNGSVKLVLTNTSPGNCLVYTDTMLITFTTVPTINAGPDQTVCSNDWPIQLAGAGSPATWTTSGTGTFSPGNNVLNAIYTPSTADSIATSVTLTLTTTANGSCAAVNDQVVLTLPPGPIVDAGPDQTECASVGSINLTGSVTNAAGGQWTRSGTGNFGNDLNPITTYTPSNADTASGTIFLILTSTGNGACTAESDSMTFTITPAVLANAGLDQTRCADNDSIYLNGTIFTAAGGRWSGGTGTYFPNDSTLNAVYTPTNADTTAGSVTFTLTSYGNGSCAGDNDDMILTFTTAPIVNAGADETICADSSGIALNGSVTIATGGLWSTLGTGTFTPSTSNLNATYEPSNADTTSGSVNLVLETTGNGDCKVTYDTLTLTIDPIPYVNAGPDQTVCADIGSTTLNGSVLNAGGGNWTSSSTGTSNFAANNSVLNAVYSLSSNDSLSGSVTLTLTSTGNGFCNAVSDQMIITATPAPTVNAGGDQILCKSEDSVSVSATFTVAGGVAWTASGDGNFVDSSLSNTFYLPTSNDTANGTVTLYASTVNAGSCNPVTDSLLVTFNDLPIVNAGPDVTICADSFSVNLTGNVINATGGAWTTTGDGNFFPNNIDLNGAYVPGNGDTTNNTVDIILTSTGNGPCAAVTDSFTITINPAPTVDAGIDQTVCADTAGITLNGIVMVASGGYWSTSGDGTFTPDSSDIGGMYIPSTTDTAAGTVTLTLTSSGNGLCNAVTDQMLVSITPEPTVNAGPNQTICADLDSITLNGQVTTATGGIWTTNGTGNFDPNNTTLNASYFHNTATDTVNLVLTTTGNGNCKTKRDTMTLIIRPIPTVEAGANQTVCNNGSGVSLNGSLTNATGGTWSTNGAGSFFPNNVTLNGTYDPDVTDTVVILTLTTTGMGTCNAVSDSIQVNITPLPIINAGANFSVCSNVTNFQLAGTFQNAQQGAWTTNGGGTFSPDTIQGNAFYTPDSSDVATGLVRFTYRTEGTGVCAQVSDNVDVSFTTPPTVNAGPDFDVCSSTDTLFLNGSSTNSSADYWFSTNGTGNFDGSGNALNAYYLRTSNDSIQGSVEFVLFSDGNGSCATESDTMVISFVAGPVISANGPDSTICTDTTGFALNGTGANGVWSGGAGTFVPAANVLNAIYKPTLAELGGAGQLTLTLTSTNSGACPVVSDTIQYTFLPPPTVSADVDITVCADTSGITLNGSFTDAGGIVWTTSGDGLFSDSSLTNAIYTPGTDDINDSSLVLTITTTGNGVCDQASDQMSIYINPAPTVNAGFDQTVCANDDTLQLNSSITISTTAGWTTNGTGSFIPDTATLKAKYLFSAVDQADTLIELYLTSTDNGFCKAVTDTVLVTITPAPTINVGLNDTLCSNNADASLNASITVAGNVMWYTTGDGIYSPTQNDTTVTYTSSTNDINAGTVTLYATTTDNGICNAVTDSLDLIYQTEPTVDAGSGSTICANNNSASINGSFSNSTGAVWTTNGTGTFSPDSVTMLADYVPSQLDKDNGGVNITLTSTGNGVCAAATDVVSITIIAAPAANVNAGLDQSICADQTGTNLQGNISNATGGLWRTIGAGSGTFSDSTQLTTFYFFSSADSLNGTVDISLETTGNGICPAVTDTLTITLTTVPTVDAGPDQTICADSTYIQLDGSYTISSGADWSTTGSGIFAPNASDSSATYSVHSDDISATTVGFVLTTTGNGTCNTYTDDMILTITPAPTANAGPDNDICADATQTSLIGSITVGTGSIWTSFGDGSIADSSQLSTTYVPGSGDINAGVVIFRLTTTGNGTCNAVSDDYRLTITPVPTVDAGSAITSCENNSSVNLNGSVTVATGGKWTNGGGTFNPNHTTLSTTYTPNANEITAGSATLYLTTTGNGKCNSYTDSVNITIVPAPIVDASVFNVCTSVNGFTQLTGTVTNATGGNWTTAGNGTFTPNSSTLNGEYTPGSLDKSNGSVILSLTSTGNGTCNAVSDSIEVLVIKLPTSNAGPDQTICRGNSTSVVGESFPNISYEWFDIAGVSLINDPILNLTANTDTTFVLTVTDLLGCSTNDSVTVFVIDPPTFGFASSFCFSDSLEIDALPSVVPAQGSFQWYTGTSLINNTDTTVLVSNKINAVGNYTIGYSYLGCSVFDTTQVTQPVSDNDAEVIFCQKDDGFVTLDAGPGDSYLWDFSGANFQFETVDSAGTFNFIVFDVNGCGVEDSILVTDICAPEVYIPTAMAPGGFQGKTLEVFGTNFTNFKIWIYNRWGEIIFYTDDADNAWDGTFNGSDMPSGVYQWRVEYEGLTEQFKGPYEQTGTVTIIR